MVQIPDSLRQQLAPVLKYRFWILAVLVPLLLLPPLFLAMSDRKAVIARGKATIDGHVSSLQAVKNEPGHPNAAWSETIDRRTAAVAQELLQEWNACWESQQPLRVWPQALGPDFLASITAVEAGNRPELQFRDLQRYQNTVPDLVRELPARMGCDDMMAGPDGEPGGAPGRPGRPPPGGFEQFGDAEGDDPEASRFQAILEWRPEDQKRLLQTFTWRKAPSTTQVRLAQEELWVYGLLCDTIKRINQGATGLFDSRITTVEQLAVGYPAAEEKPGGQGTARVIGVRQPLGGPGGFEEGLPPTDPAADTAGGMPTVPQGRPSNPRFSDGAGGFEGLEAGGRGLPPGMPAEGSPDAAGAEGQAPALSVDEMLKQWIYVDFTGRPLTAPELTTSPDARFVHLVPFVLRVVMDQREIDRLLADLAGAAVPIDVRQLRINPSESSATGEFGSAGLPGTTTPLAGGLGGPGGAPQERRRPFDVTVELRGTVGLATPPNPAAFSPAENDAAANDGSGT